MKAALALSALAAGGLLLAACSGDGKTSGPSAGAQVVTVALTNQGCAPDRTELNAGQARFEITNKGGSRVSEVELMDGDNILAEKENIASGFSGSFSLELKPGSYDLYCPGAATPRTPVKVTAASGSNSGNGRTGTTTTDGVSATVIADEQDFSIRLDRNSVHAGTVTFNIHNNGDTTHELVVIKTDLPPDKLPQSADGNQADENQLVEVGEKEDIEAGGSATLSLRLPSGKYVVICNVPGHYNLGMYTAVTVN